MANPTPSRKILKNEAQPRPMTKNEVVRTARMQYHINNLRTDYDQVILRISYYPDNGLGNGAAPGKVGF